MNDLVWESWTIVLIIILFILGKFFNSNQIHGFIPRISGINRRMALPWKAAPETRLFIPFAPLDDHQLFAYRKTPGICRWKIPIFLETETAGHLRVGWFISRIKAIGILKTQHGNGSPWSNDNPSHSKSSSHTCLGAVSWGLSEWSIPSRSRLLNTLCGIGMATFPCKTRGKSTNT